MHAGVTFDTAFISNQAHGIIDYHDTPQIHYAQTYVETPCRLLLQTGCKAVPTEAQANRFSASDGASTAFTDVLRVERGRSDCSVALGCSRTCA